MKYNTIVSSVEAFIAELIAKDQKIDKIYFYEIFLTVFWNAEKSVLQFASLKGVWERGLVMKRYLEYPIEQPNLLQDVFAELNIYLNKGNYVLHFTERNLGFEVINLILGVSVPDRKVNFLTWQSKDGIVKNSLSYEEYGDKYMSFCSLTKMMRFDIYQPIAKNNEGIIDLHALLNKLQAGKIPLFDRKHCLFCAANRVTSSQVLQEWFSIVEEVLDWLYEEKIIRTADILSDRERRLFKTDIMGISIRNLHQMLKGYNKIIDKLRGYLEEIVNEKNFKES